MLKRNYQRNFNSPSETLRPSGHITADKGYGATHLRPNASPKLPSALRPNRLRRLRKAQERYTPFALSQWRYQDET